MHNMVRFPLLMNLALGLLLMGVVGCGPTGYKATGKITKGGEPMKLTDKAVVKIALYAESDKSFAEPFAVTWDKPFDGTFKVVGREGAGVPAGKYRVSIEVMDKYPDTRDSLGGKKARENAPVIEIKDASEFVIAVDK